MRAFAVAAVSLGLLAAAPTSTHAYRQLDRVAGTVASHGLAATTLQCRWRRCHPGGGRYCRLCTRYPGGWRCGPWQCTRR